MPEVINNSMSADSWIDEIEYGVKRGTHKEREREAYEEAEREERQ